MIETMNIRCDHRGYLLKHRDSWKKFYGVSVWFPRGLRYGAYQEMKMEGLPMKIREVKSLVNMVIAEAEAEYNAYKIRRELRNCGNFSKAIKMETNVSKVKVEVKRGFEVLMDLDDGESTNCVEKEEEERANVEVEWPCLSNKEKTSYVTEEEEKPLGAWGDE